MLKAVTFILLSLLAVACGPQFSDHYTVLADPSCTSAQVASLIFATERWEHATPVKFDVKIGDCKSDVFHEHTICVTPSTLSSIAARTPVIPVSGTHHIMTTGRLGDDNENAIDCAHIYFATDDTYKYDATLLFTHELGHALGLKHDVPETAMAPTDKIMAHYVTAEDAKNYEQLRGR